jgi:LPPG:FO 2-phospho-L-lactate transferase
MTAVTILSGGVGGARAGRGFDSVLGPGELAIVVNVGDDERIHGVHVSPDIDTVLYTLADREGSQGWGLADDTYTVMDRLAAAGEDTRFRLGDADFALCLARTRALEAGEPLSAIVARTASLLGIDRRVIPVTDGALRTRIETTTGEWLDFQEYFVYRGQRDEVATIEYSGSGLVGPAPGVLDAITAADLVVIAPSNPPLSVWPILAVPGVRDALSRARRVVAVSPLFSGIALKGPAHRVMASLGLPAGNAGVLAAYRGLLTDLVIDVGDAADAAQLQGEVQIHTTDTRIAARPDAARLASFIMDLA